MIGFRFIDIVDMGDMEAEVDAVGLILEVSTVAPGSFMVISTGSLTRTNGLPNPSPRPPPRTSSTSLPESLLLGGLTISLGRADKKSEVERPFLSSIKCDSGVSSTLSQKLLVIPVSASSLSSSSSSWFPFLPRAISSYSRSRSSEQNELFLNGLGLRQDLGGVIAGVEVEGEGLFVIF